MQRRNTNLLLEDARAAIEKRELANAESYLLQALQAEKCADILLLLGLVYVNTGRAADAIRTYSDLLNLDPTNRDGLEWLSTLYTQNGKFEEALKIASRALELYPQEAFCYSTLGACRFAEKSWSEAAKLYEQASRLEPRLAANHHFAGIAFYRLGQKRQAEKALRQAALLQPRSHATLFELGRLLIDKKDYEGATEALRRAAQISPLSHYFVFLAKAYALSEKFDESMEALRRAIAINPRAKLAYEMLGERFQDRGDFGQAIQAFQTALEIDSTTAAAYYGISRCRKMTTEDLPMIQRMEELLLMPASTEDDLRHLNYGLAKTHEDLGRYEIAIRYYDEANRLAKLQRPQLAVAAGAVKWGESKLFKTYRPEFFKKHASLGSRSDRPIFIVGMIRSGTTLTEQILSSHRDIAGGGEIKFWMEDQAIDVLKAAMNGAPFEKKAQQLVKEYDQILDRLGGAAPRVTDKMPINYIALGLMHLLYPKAKIIHCRRNPIDTCLSIYTTPLGTGPGFAYDRQDIVDTYREYQMIMKHWRGVLPADTMIEVQYEELVENSEAKIRELVAFLGLKWDDACLAHDRNERNVMTPSRWQARQPVYKTSVEKWRRYEPWLGVFAELLDNGPEK